MCDSCGCNVTPGNQHLVKPNGKLAKTREGLSAVKILKSLLSENDHQAAHNRQHFDQHQVLAVNLMSSPGSGKTALLEATIDALKNEFKLAVIEGDLETENDAERIRSKGIAAIQITTGSACHLDAHMVHDALHHLDLAPLDLVFIENVGNLVCPASFDLGHHLNVILLSATEGDDKPAKYPVMFRAADLMLISKSDLLPVLDDFIPQLAVDNLRNLASEAPVFALSAKNQQGMPQWLNWLREKIKQQQQMLTEGKTLTPSIQKDTGHLDKNDQHAHQPVTTLSL
jgi:hydrogenase nickel incorporation protein HypB